MRYIRCSKSVVRSVGLLVICVFGITIPKSANADELDSTLRSPTLYVETFMQMQAVLYAASGDRAVADCIQNSYMKSPRLVPTAVEGFRKFRGYDADDAMQSWVYTWCSPKRVYGPVSKTSDASGPTSVDSPRIERDIRAELNAAIHSTSLYAFFDLGNDRQGLCVGLQVIGDSMDLLEMRLMDDASLSVVEVVYDQARHNCKLLPDAPDFAKLSNINQAELQAAAEERLRYVSYRAEPDLASRPARY